jgi:hypothetical protein
LFTFIVTRARGRIASKAFVVGKDGLTNAVHVTAARLRFVLNLKGRGVGGGL